MWRFGEGEPQLCSLGEHPPWPAGRAEVGVCYWLPQRIDTQRYRDYRPHPTPRRGCARGVYALKTQEALTELRRPHTHRWSRAAALATLVWGEVSLWGTVIEHEHGYRAQYAYPRRITVPANYRGFLHADDRQTIRRIFADEAAGLVADRYRIQTELE